MTNKEYKVASYNAYIAYVEYDEGKTDFATFVNRAFPAFYENGIELHNDEASRDMLYRIASHSMNAIGTETDEAGNKEKVRKIKSISTFRSMLKNWNELSSRRIVYNAGKDPDLKAKEKNDKRVKEALEVMAACGIDITDELRKRASNWNMAPTVNK